jgi:putative transcription factor
MECEMCGTDAELKKTKVEGAVLQLCDDCQATGEVMETSTSSSSNRGRSQGGKKRRKSRRQEKQLAPDFGDRVKEARESKELSMADLAECINEKKSVVRRIESEDMKPDKRLASKLRGELDVELYTSSPDVEYKSRGNDASSGGATIGDVADIKKREG